MIECVYNGSLTEGEPSVAYRGSLAHSRQLSTHVANCTMRMPPAPAPMTCCHNAPHDPAGCHMPMDSRATSTSLACTVCAAQYSTRTSHHDSRAQTAGVRTMLNGHARPNRCHLPRRSHRRRAGARGPTDHRHPGCVSVELQQSKHSGQRPPLATCTPCTTPKQEGSLHRDDHTTPSIH